MIKALNYKEHKNISSDFVSLCREAFPRVEVPPKRKLLKAAADNNVSLLCFYENDDFIGLTYDIQENHFVYLFLLAIQKSKRGQGYGEMIINEIKKRYQNKDIVLAYEEVKEKYANYEQRKKREQFYIKNGFYPIDLKTNEFGVNFQIASTNKDLEMTIEEYRQCVGLVFGKVLTRIFIKERKS